MTVREFLDLLGDVPGCFDVWLLTTYGMGGLDEGYLFIDPEEGRLIIDVSEKARPPAVPLSEWLESHDTAEEDVC